MYASSLDSVDPILIGNNRMFLASYDNYELAHFNHSNVVLTLIGSKKAKVGLMIDFSDELKPLISDIAHAVIRD